MNITNAKKIRDVFLDEVINLKVTIDSKTYYIPYKENKDYPDNIVWAEVKKLVDAGELTIEEAD